MQPSTVRLSMDVRYQSALGPIEQRSLTGRWSLLFMDIQLIAIPPLIMIIVSIRKIVEVMTADSVKG